MAVAEPASAAAGCDAPVKEAALPLLVQLQAVVDNAAMGDADAIRRLWSAEAAERFSAATADEEDHPLLHAVHRNRPDAVAALCTLGLSPLQPGTLRPYTGDGFSVSDLRRITPLELVERMLVQCSRRSKRRSALLRIRSTLEATFQQQQAAHIARIQQEEGMSDAAMTLSPLMGASGSHSGGQATRS